MLLLFLLPLAVSSAAHAQDATEAERLTLAFVVEVCSCSRWAGFGLGRIKAGDESAGSGASGSGTGGDSADDTTAFCACSGVSRGEVGIGTRAASGEPSTAGVQVIVGGTDALYQLDGATAFGEYPFVSSVASVSAFTLTELRASLRTRGHRCFSWAGCARRRPI